MCYRHHESAGQAARFVFRMSWQAARGGCIALLALSAAAAQSTPVHAPTPTPTATRTSTPSVSPTPTPTPTPSPTLPLPAADANCDRRGTVADFSAAIIVSGDATRFPGCAGADSFRGRRLSDQDVVAILADIFDTFGAPPTPTPSPSATITRTPNGTSTPTRTARPTTTRTASPTATQTSTPSATPTPTATAVPTVTPTETFTRTATVTRTATATPTPTGIAFRLSGDWLAHWSGQICYLNGQPFDRLRDTTYRVTAVDGRLDVEIVNGARLGRGLALDGNGTVETTFRVFDGVCLVSGVREEYVFDYIFTFHLNGTGSAAAHWTYGFNTFCASCEVDDSATLLRVGPPQ
jgi:hypothetical protein